MSNALQEAQTCFSVNEGHPIDGHAHPLPGFVQDIAKAGGLINYIKENK